MSPVLVFMKICEFRTYISMCEAIATLDLVPGKHYDLLFRYWSGRMVGNVYKFNVQILSSEIQVLILDHHKLVHKMLGSLLLYSENLVIQVYQFLFLWKKKCHLFSLYSSHISQDEFETHLAWSSVAILNLVIEIAQDGLL